MVLSPGRNVWRTTSVERAGLLVDGAIYYRELHGAARRARRSILMSGWQFDSEVALLRGDDAQGATCPVTMVKFLNHLCAARPELEIYLLAWDFHAVFAIEREWLQKVLFDWRTSERLHFQFDANHAPSGSHHQKFVVIDGELSFLGGLDVCDHRWDDRRHLAVNPDRVSRGAPHKPFHDVQAYLVGREPAAALTELFAARWLAAGGEPGVPTEVPAERGLADFAPAGALPVPSARAALSRTDPLGKPGGETGIREIETLHLDAIAAAERRIYVETQYFSARAVCAALIARLRAPGRPSLDVVLVLNVRGENLKEQVAVGLAQAKVLGELRTAAQGTPHALGIYYTVPEGGSDAAAPLATYIHSKLMVVDDRLLIVGSANLTNRSLGVDSELNVSFETDDPSDELGRAIAAIRRDLLAEHTGRNDPPDAVAELDALAGSGATRLRPHPSPTPGELAVIEVVDPHTLPFDPATPQGNDPPEDPRDEIEEDRSRFVSGLGALWRRLFEPSEDPSKTSP